MKFPMKPGSCDSFCEFLEVQLNSALQSDAGQQHSIPNSPGKTHSRVHRPGWDPIEIASETSPNDSSRLLAVLRFRFVKVYIAVGEIPI